MYKKGLKKNITTPLTIIQLQTSNITDIVEAFCGHSDPNLLLDLPQGSYSPNFDA